MIRIVGTPQGWSKSEGRRSSSLHAAVGSVKPFGFDSTLDVRPQASPKTLRSDPAGCILQAKDLVELSNNLTERQKIIAEYWDWSKGRGTNVILWNQFAQFVARRDHDQLDNDVKLFFALNNAMFDASIAAWDAKRYWDSERPQTAIATLARIFHGYLFHNDWQPYLPTPPFPDFVSSHSTVSAAAAEVLERCGHSTWGPGPGAFSMVLLIDT